MASVEDERAQVLNAYKTKVREHREMESRCALLRGFWRSSGSLRRAIGAAVSSERSRSGERGDLTLFAGMQRQEHA